MQTSTEKVWAKTTQPSFDPLSRPWTPKICVLKSLLHQRYSTVCPYQSDHQIVILSAQSEDFPFRSILLRLLMHLFPCTI